VERNGRTPRRLAGAAALALLAAPATATDDDLATCRGIADDRARLACYDAVAAATAVPVASAATPAAPPVVPAPAPTAVELFGRDSDSAAEALGAAAGVAPLAGLSATLTNVARAPDGRLMLTLDNGQAWSQVDTRRVVLQAGDAVVIRRAALGSYLLSTGRRQASVRVRRDR
jgi:hypothetical protein